MQKEELVVLEFASKRLSAAERRWDTREREAFAIRWAVQRFEDFAKANRVVVLSDHESLRWMWKATSGKVQRWALYLQQFDLTFAYVQGETNAIADFMSRSVDEDPYADEDVATVTVPAFVALAQRT
eukprot:Polyplicarium_translucidae@DN3405_c2_g1_i1.p6